MDKDLYHVNSSTNIVGGSLGARKKTFKFISAYAGRSPIYNTRMGLNDSLYLRVLILVKYFQLVGLVAPSVPVPKELVRQLSVFRLLYTV